MSRPWTGPEPVLRVRIDRVVMDADVGPAGVSRAALTRALQDAVQQHLHPQDGAEHHPEHPASLDSAGRAVAAAVRGALGPSPGRAGAS